MKLFALEGSHRQGAAIAECLGLEPSPLEEREFEDGEFKIRPLVPVAGMDVCVVHSLYGDTSRSPSDKLWRTAVAIGALKDAGARHVSAVLPYLAFARKDRRTKLFDPVTIRYVAQLLEAVGCDRVITLDVHNDAAFENAFRCQAVHVESTTLFARFLTDRLAGEACTLVSPDVGGIKRVQKLVLALDQLGVDGLDIGFLEKHRSQDVISGASGLVGGVQSGGTAVVLDDLIGSGHTISRAVDACGKAGAVTILALATHGLFVGDADRNLADPRLTEIVVTDTVPPFRLGTELVQGKVRILQAAPSIAEALDTRRNAYSQD